MSLVRANHAAEVHILLFCSHSMCQQHIMPQFSHKSEKETAFVSHLNLDSQSFTSQAPSLASAFVRGQVSNIGRKKLLVSFQSLAALPLVQGLDFDNYRIYKYKKIPKVSFACFGIFLPTFQHLFHNLHFCKNYLLFHTNSPPEGIKLLEPTLLTVTHIPISRRLEFLK